MELLSITEPARRNLARLEKCLAPNIDAIAERWADLYLAANPGQSDHRDKLERECREHLCLLVAATESGDFRRYFRWVAAVGKQMARTGFSYYDVVASVHFLEQAVVETMTEDSDHSEGVYSLLRSLDDVFHNEIGVLSQQYFRVKEEALTRRSRELFRRNRQLAALNAIAGELSSSFDANQVLDCSLNLLLQVLELDGASIYLVDEATSELVLTVHRGLSRRLPIQFARRALSMATAHGRAALSTQPCVIEDCSTDPRLNQEEANTFTAEGICSTIASPLRLGDKLLGLICLGARTPRIFTTQDIQFVSSVAHQLSVAFEKARLYADARRSMEEATALYEAAKRLQASAKTYFHLFEEARTVLKEMFGYRECTIALLEGDELSLYGVQNRSRKGVRWEEEVARRLVAQGRALLMADAVQASELRDLQPPRRVRAVAAVPLRVGGDVIGAVVVHRPRAGTLGDRDVRLLSSLADYLAVAIENVRLYHKRRHVAVIEERNRLAREIHDVLAHTFTGLIFHLEAADSFLVKGFPTEGLAAVHSALTSARGGLQEARRSVLGLRPCALEEMSLVDAIRERLDDLREVGINVEFEVNGRPTLPPEHEANLYRVVEEAISNVLKHAFAKKACVRIDFSTEQATIVVQDDGKGFDPDDLRNGGPKGFGLLGMNQRVRLMDGALNIQSGEGLGTRLVAVVPVGRLVEGGEL